MAPGRLVFRMPDPCAKFPLAISRPPFSIAPMPEFPEPLDLTRLRVYPLAQRRSMARVEDTLVDPRAEQPALPEFNARQISCCAQRILAARERGASVIMFDGAHLVQNSGATIVQRLLDGGWITHLATNGAGTIHDWEFAFCGRSTESVRDNVATGTFGTWDETGRNLELALMTGALCGDGYGISLGRFIAEDGTTMPDPVELEKLLRDEPAHHLTPARAELLQAMRAFRLPAGRIEVKHEFKSASILGFAFTRRVPVTVHPGIGYDIISNHPMFNGAVIGRAAGHDFRLIGRAAEGLDGGVVLSVGSAIMAPQVFEKTLSCVNNLRLQAGRDIVREHEVFVVDLQDGGNWDWTTGEPPKDNPAYYLRFCKSFSRMGGAMHYVQCDNVAFLSALLRRLEETKP